MRLAPDIHNFSDILNHCANTILDKGSMYRHNWDVYQYYDKAAKALRKVKNASQLLQYYQTYEKKEANNFIRWLRTRGILETSGISSANAARDPQRVVQWLDTQLNGKSAGLDNQMLDILDI